MMVYMNIIVIEEVVKLRDLIKLLEKEGLSEFVFFVFFLICVLFFEWLFDIFLFILLMVLEKLYIYLFMV